jgi:hypothetical protein
MQLGLVFLARKPKSMNDFHGRRQALIGTRWLDMALGPEVTTAMLR